ncbi:hypothetical protein HMPREF1861_00695 [Corynebacterium kroppenstedtii]|nr:hypothetical protein HMPREF1861_00695 [Corynebacterium kroppenstedtii]
MISSTIRSAETTLLTSAIIFSVNSLLSSVLRHIKHSYDTCFTKIC